MQVRTPFTPDRLAALQSNLSAERLARYLNDTGGDQVAAVALYEWNMAISEAFYSPLQNLEVVLRNALGNALRARYGADWYLQGGVPPLMYPLPEMLAKAREELTRRGIALEHGRILAELNFGFWGGLLSSRYETSLWRPIFFRAFADRPAGFKRKTVHDPIERLRRFRNRIAHHEPIHDRNLAEDYAEILKVVGWISPYMAVWLDETSKVTAVLAARP
ncbi:hypothetical protein ASD04_11265 [Devosia sp. Root436]|nr:hypothetical protein ASD04_11265 [Devosia sp. Root436]